MRYSFKIWLFIVVSLIFVSVSKSLAQRIKPTITFHTERLPEEEKQYLAGLDTKLEQLIIDNSWGDKIHNYTFPLKIDIFFEKYIRSPLQRRYTAGILMTVREGIQFKDRRWEFPYSQDEQLHFGDPYHPLTGLIEFYIYLALARESDLYTPLGGEDYGQKAYMVAQSSRSEALYPLGWDARRELADFFNNDTTITNLRQAAFFARAGAMYLTKNNPSVAENALRYAVELLLKVPPQMVELRRDDHIIRFVDLNRLIEALNEAKLDDLAEQLEKWYNENNEINE